MLKKLTKRNKLLIGIFFSGLITLLIYFITKKSGSGSGSGPGSEPPDPTIPPIVPAQHPTGKPKKDGIFGNWVYGYVDNSAKLGRYTVNKDGTPGGMAKVLLDDYLPSIININGDLEKKKKMLYFI